ncbi:tyrosine-type recombinase/integrase [Phreatobacter oligotrophus]|uniref:Site-specific recombinase XerD n=1 Tax=Phreatobacter oligotrophus TaxID=1122261 RepID=A0A2T4ZDV9_9HYPH|nr:site-specific integrase [Phreatobacter oligotrophus]PTM60078.1 site-specific recombinase XerD [Phreatobacter oligotrophus]
MSYQSTHRSLSKKRGAGQVAPYNAKNERLKRQHATFLKEAEGFGDEAVRHAMATIDDFEAFRNRNCFGEFRSADAIAYKAHLAQRISRKTGEPLSKVSQQRAVHGLQRFFRWLAEQPGYRTRIRASDADYFRLSRRDQSIAKVVNRRTPPSIQDVERLLAAMPSESLVDKRNRAIVAVLILTGARVGAVASLRIKHLDLTRRLLVQDPREVKTKFAKTIETYLIPIDGDAFPALEEWVRVLTVDMGWGPDDPLFPKTATAMGPDLVFVQAGVDRDPWRSGIPIRRILEEACKAAGLPYFNPHAFRHAVARLGLERARTPEQMKAWSQNMGHTGLLTTLHHYGSVDPERQRQIVEGMKAAASNDLRDELEKLLRSHSR